MSSQTTFNTCPCANGGICLNGVNAEIQMQICECPIGFVGPTCADFSIDLSHNSKSETNLHIIVIITLTLCVLVMMSLFSFFAWRRINSIKKRRDEMEHHRNRRQSRVTIEGFSHSGNNVWEMNENQSNSNDSKSILLPQNEFKSIKTDASNHLDITPVNVTVHI